MKLIKYFFLFVSIFLIVGCNKKDISDDLDDTSIELFSSANSWTDINTDLKTGKVNSCVLARSLIVYDQIEFEYIFNDEYSSVEFNTNTDEVEIINDDNKVKYVYSKLRFVDKETNAGGATIALCFDITLNDIYQETELKLINIVFKDSQTNKEYKVDDYFYSVKYR